MATPPKKRGLDIPKGTSVKVDEQDVPTQAQIDALVAQINDFMNTVKIALEGALSQENFRRQVKVLRVSPNQEYPYRFDCTLSARPVAIRCVQTATLSGPAPTAAVDVSQWQMRDTKTLEFLAIPGLAAAGTYDLTLFIE